MFLKMGHFDSETKWHGFWKLTALPFIWCIREFLGGLGSEENCVRRCWFEGFEGKSQKNGPSSSVSWLSNTEMGQTDRRICRPWNKEKTHGNPFETEEHEFLPNQNLPKTRRYTKWTARPWAFRNRATLFLNRNAPIIWFWFLAS